MSDYTLDLADNHLNARETYILGRVMAHIASWDAANGSKQTVIGIQLDNEVRSLQVATLQILAICRGRRFDSKWRRRISRVCRMGNLFSDNMFSFDFRKTSAWHYQRRLLRPGPTVTVTFHMGRNYAMWDMITVKQQMRPTSTGIRSSHCEMAKPRGFDTISSLILCLVQSLVCGRQQALRHFGGSIDIRGRSSRANTCSHRAFDLRICICRKPKSLDRRAHLFSGIGCTCPICIRKNDRDFISPIAGNNICNTHGISDSNSGCAKAVISCRMSVPII